MTDRELLELAAKAAGYAISHRWNEERLLLNPPVIDLCIPGVSTGWNPLTDDGDALRLAVKLELFDLDRLLVDLDIEDAKTSTNRDPCVATRRAIVIAAAKRGMSLK